MIHRTVTRDVTIQSTMSDSEGEASDDEAPIEVPVRMVEGLEEDVGSASDEDADRKQKGEHVVERKERTCKICSTSGE